MRTDRKTAIITGILFLVATGAGVLSFPFLSPLRDPEWLNNIGASRNLVITGTLLLVIMAFACAAIGIGLYPVLRRYNEALALGAAGFRIIEAILHIVSVLGILPLLTLSEEYVKAGAPEFQPYLASGAILESIRETGSNMALISWCVGASLYYYVFYRSKLIPRWLAGWGLIGLLFAMSAILLDLFTGINTLSPIHTALNIPIAVQEMVLAIYLIARGFNINSLVTGSWTPEQHAKQDN